MDQTNFLENVAKCPEFGSEDWIQFEALSLLIEKQTDPVIFSQKLKDSIRHSDEIFITKQNQKNGTNQDLTAFAKGNVEAVEAILKIYKEEMEEIDVSDVFTKASFYEFALPTKTTLSSDAKPFTPTSPTLNASAPVWTPNADAKPFTFSTDAPEWTPSSSLSVEAPEFKPSFSIDAPEFVPSFSSKPVCMPSALGITEGNANDCSHFDYDSFFDDSPGRPVSFSTIVAPPPVEEKPKVYICEVEKREYSVDWLLQVRLEKKFINPAPEIPADVAHPLFRRTEIWTEKQFNPYKYETNEDDFGFESLGKLVTPVFQDEIDHEEICDPMSGQYGINVLKRMQPHYRDIHPALIDKPEILNKDTINNIIMQFMAVGGMNPLFQASLNGGIGPAGFPAILPPNMEIPPHILQMLPPSMAQNFMAIKAMIQCGAGKSSWLDDPNPPVPVEEFSTDDEGKEEPEKETPAKEKNPPPAPATPKKNRSPRSKSKKPKKVSAPRFSKGELTETPEKKAQPKLHKALNKWSRRGVVEKEEDLAARTMQSILNKLVPEKFDRLLKKALDTKQLVVTKKATLLSLAERIYKKAISEADYAPLYTHFVHKLVKADFQSFAENGEDINIETVLLDRCLDRLNEQVTLEEDDEEKELKEIKFWKETLGNYTLLGELYKREVLEHSKLSAIVVTLVGIVVNPEEDHDTRAKRVEQLFHLLKSCGTEFEEECKERNHFRADEPHILEKHFVEIAKAAEDPTLKPRVRFMLQDLVELKNKHWESRNNGGMDPKFLSEIREDIRKEQMKKKQFLYKLRRQAPGKDRSSKRRSQTPRASTRSSKRRGNHTPRDSPRSRRCLKSLSDSNVLSRAEKKKKDSVIPIKSKRSSPRIDKIRWAKIVQGHMEEDADTPTAKSVPVQTPPPRVVNAWAKGPPSNLTKTNEIDETKEDIKTNISSDPSDTFSQPSDSTTNENELDELIIETKLLEYFEDADPALGVSNFKDILESGVKAEQLVVTSLNLTIEKKDKHRKILSDLFVQLLTQKVFSSEDVIDGFRKCSEFFEDWQVDVPRLPEFVRSWISPLVEQDLCKQSDFSFLPDRFILDPLETRI